MFNTEASNSAPDILYTVPAAHSVFAAPIVTGAELKAGIRDTVERTLNAWPAFQGRYTTHCMVDVRFTEAGASASVQTHRTLRAGAIGTAGRRSGWPATAQTYNATCIMSLPAVDDDRRVPRAVALDWLAYALHESMHVMLSTSFRNGPFATPEERTHAARSYETLSRVHRLSYSPISIMLNGLEDARMENAAVHHRIVAGYPNAAVNLVAQHVRVGYGKPARTAEDLCHLLAYAGRAWAPAALRKAARDCVPAPYLPMFDDACRRLRDMATDCKPWELGTYQHGTGRCVDLLLDLLAAVQALQDAPQDAPQAGAGDGDAPQDGTGDGAGDAPQDGADDGAGDGDTPQDGAGDGAGDGDTPQDGTGDGAGCGAQGSDPITVQPQGTSPFDSTMHGGAALDPSAADAKSPLCVASVASTKTQYAAAPAGRVESILHAARQAPGAPRVGAILRALLAKTDRTDFERGLKAGRITRTALARIPTGAVNVFERRDRYGADAAAVAIAIDSSSSMAMEGRMSAAKSAALLICDALRAAQGSETMVYAFGDPIESRDKAIGRKIGRAHV